MMALPEGVPARDVHAVRALTPSERRQTLRDGTIDGSLYTAMLGVGESNLVAFALAMGLGAVWGGLAASIPVVLGALIQLLIPWVVRRVGSHKVVLVSCAAVQACVWLILAGLAGLWSNEPGEGGVLITAALYGLITVYWTMALGAGTAWATFMSQAIPARIRASYFATRTRIQNTALVLGTLAGGVVLFFGQRSDDGAEWWRWLCGWGGGVYPFIVLFLAASSLRFLSSAYLLKQVEVAAIPRGQRDVPLRELFGRYRRGPGGRLILYMLAAQLAIQISTPFVTPYLLEHLGLKYNYGEFGVLMGVLILAKVAVLPMLGRLANRRGERILLLVGGLLIVPLPALWWLAGGDFTGLLLVQAANGAGLAAFELGTLLLLFEDIQEHERTSVMARYQVVNYAATLAGSFIGAAVLRGLGEVGAGYAAVFGVSLVARALTIPLMLAVVRGSPASVSLVGSLDVHPMPGTMDEPLLAPKPRREEDRNGP